MRPPTLLTTTTPLAATAAVLTTASTPPTLSTSTTIKLIANVTWPSNDALTIQSYELSTYPRTSACDSILGLAPPGEGALWTLSPETSTLVTVDPAAPPLHPLLPRASGTATVPPALPVTLTCGPGTPNVTVVLKNDNNNGGGVPVLSDGLLSAPDDGYADGYARGYMACAVGTLGEGEAEDAGAGAVVGHKWSGQRVLAGCEAVDFVAVCVEDGDGGVGGGEGEEGNAVACVVPGGV